MEASSAGNSVSNSFDDANKAVYKSNYLLAFIYDRAFEKVGPKTFCVLMVVVPLLLAFLAGIVDGTLYSTLGLLGVAEDYALYAILSVVAFTTYIYYRFSRFLDRFFSFKLPLILNHSALPQDEINTLLRTFSDIVSPRRVYLVLYWAFIVGGLVLWTVIVLNAFNPVDLYGKDIWHSTSHLTGFAFAKIFNLVFLVGLVSVLVYKFCLGLIAFSWLFYKISHRNGFLIKPLSPDKSAGLKVLSDLSLYYMYMVLPFFLVVFSYLLRGTYLLPTQQAMFAFLIAMLFLTFFLPLGSVHYAMKRAKEQELEKIGLHFQELNDATKEQLSRKQYDDNTLKQIQLLEKVDFIYQKTDKMPVWPFNLGNLGRVLAAASIPLVVLLLELLTNPDSILYHPEKIGWLFIR